MQGENPQQEDRVLLTAPYGQDWSVSVDSITQSTL